MAIYFSSETAVNPGAEAEYARVARVGEQFFDVFRMEPEIGRAFTDEETVPGGAGAVLVSDAYWRSRFGGEPDAIGQSIRLLN